MLCIIKGDLLNRSNGVNFVLHQANCESVMGAGIAEAIARRYPLAAEVDRQFEYSPDERMGKYSIAKIEEKYYIVNLYGQRFPGTARSVEEQEMRYRSLEKALKSFLVDLQKKQKIEQEKYKVGLPYKMASSLAGGNWERVLDILINVSEESGIDLYIYKM